MSLTNLVLVLIYIYQQMISPWLPMCCRFQPTCSEYGREAFRLHGFWRGGYLTLRRLLRCHPWGGCGYDPVPPAKDRKDVK